MITQYKVMPGPEHFLPPAAACMGNALPDPGQGHIHGTIVQEDQAMEEIPAQEEAVLVKEAVSAVSEEQPPVSAEKQRFCRQCGTPLRSGATFCTKCGHQQTERGG